MLLPKTKADNLQQDANINYLNKSINNLDKSINTGNQSGAVKKSEVEWACRRGMLELDKVLLTFCNLVFDTLNAAQQQNFVQFLKATDNELYSWIFGDCVPQEHKLQDLSLYLRHLAKAGLCR